MTAIDSIKADYVTKSIFGTLADVEVEATSTHITKNTITKLVNGFFKEYWETGHVNCIKVNLTDGRLICIMVADRQAKTLEVVEWHASNSRDTHIKPAREVSALLRSMVAE